jgi:DNA-binding PucR family transcriptional regulator
VHPNTCRYRLARAEQLFGLALADPDERLLLWLQLRLAIV